MFETRQQDCQVGNLTYKAAKVAKKSLHCNNEDIFFKDGTKNFLAGFFTSTKSSSIPYDGLNTFMPTTP
jgi:hypothetical protein